MEKKRVPALEKNQYFLYRALRFFLILSLLSAAFVIVSLIQYNRLIKREITTLATNQLEQVMEKADYLFTSLQEYTGTIYYHPVINRWLHAKERTPLGDQEAYLQLQALIRYNPFINRAYLINTSQRIVYDSSQRLFTFGEFGEKELLERIVFTPSPHFELLPLTLRGSSSNNYREEDALALIMPGPPQLIGSRGCLALILSRETLEDFVLQSKEIRESDFYFSRGKEIMLSTFESALTQEKGEYSLSISRPFPLFDWDLTMLIHLDFLGEHFNQFQKTMIILWILFYTISFSTIFVTMSRIYRPVTQMADKLRAGLNLSGEIKDGMVLLDRGIDRLLKDSSQHRDDIIKNILRQMIVSGRMDGFQSEYLGEHLRLEEGQALYLIVSRMAGYRRFYDAHSFQERKGKKIRLLTDLEQALSDQGLRLWGFDSGNDSLHFVLLTDGEGIARAERLLCDLDAPPHDPVRLIHGISDPHRLEDDLCFLNDSIYELTLLHFIWDQRSIFHEKDYEEYASLSRDYEEEDQVEALITAVKEGNGDKMEKILSGIFQKLHNLAFEESRFRLLMISYGLYQDFSKLLDFSSFQEIRRITEAFDTLRAAEDWFSRELNGIISQLTGKSTKQKHAEIVEELTDYIDNNLANPLLSPVTAADHIGLSTNYIRLIFKESGKGSLSAHILQCRLNLAKQLLTSTNLSVNEIARKSGFVAKSHFYGTFKRETGLTPTQYREIYQNKNLSSK